MKSFYEIVPCVRVKVFSEGLTLHHRRIWGIFTAGGGDI
jgi:hypothetical protein